MAVNDERLGDERLHGAARRQARDRILEHHRDFAMIGAIRHPAPRERVLAGEFDVARGDRRQADDGARQGRLAGAALADDGKVVPRRDIEGDVEHGIDDSGTARPVSIALTGPAIA